MDSSAEADDLLQMDSPMEAPVDLPSEEEELEKEKETPRPADVATFASTATGGAPGEDEDETIKIGYVEVPKHLRRPTETPRELVLDYQEHLPYPVESLQDMDDRLDLIARKLVDCVEARDYDV